MPSLEPDKRAQQGSPRRTSAPQTSDGATGKLRVVLIAPPGAGKGTQGDLIATHYGVPRVSSGELLRLEVERQTPTGILIAEELHRGELVKDSIVSSVVFHKLSESGGGFVLDGFPRTVAQAIATEEWTVAAGLPLDAAIELQVPREEVLHRIRHRAVDAPRSDDALRVVLHRLDGYHREAQDLLEFYGQRGILISVDGTGDIDDVAQRIRTQLDRVLASSGSTQSG